jgi:anti-anti-sigma regulatory factor
MHDTYFSAVLDAMPEGFVTHEIVYDENEAPVDYRITHVNRAFEQMLGMSREKVVGQCASTVYGAPAFLDIYANVAQTGNPHYFDAPFGEKVYNVRAFSSRRGEFVTLFFDVTEDRQQIAAQQEALRELSTPLLPIVPGVLVVPLIGTIDSARVQESTETILEGVSRQQAELVILDITGVPRVDTMVAQAFMQIAATLRLLGARVVLTGIQPMIAQTLVALGVDLTGITTFGTLQAGVLAVLEQERKQKRV